MEKERGRNRERETEREKQRERKRAGEYSTGTFLLRLQTNCNLLQRLTR